MSTPELRSVADLDDETLAAALGEKFTTIVGRVVPYGERTNVGFYTEEVARGCFTESLVVMAKVPLLWSHEQGQLPVGVADEWEDRSDGLWARFRVSGNPLAQTIAGETRDGFIGGLSVGFVPEESRWTYVSDWDPDVGKLDHVVRTRARLLEVSLTPTPAYVGAIVTDVEAEPLADGARSNLRRAQFQRRADVRVREYDEARDRQARAAVELARWRRYREAIRRT